MSSDDSPPHSPVRSPRVGAPRSAARLMDEQDHGGEGGPGRLERMHATLAALRAGKTPSGPIDLAGLRLIEEDLSGLDLTGADLSGCDLSRARMHKCILLRANLSGASLFHARLAGAELSGADLTGANLQGAKLTGAGLGSADLTGASLVEADLRGTTLVEARLVGADLRLADLSGARALAADWTRADLRKARLHRTELDRGNLRKARLDGADLRHAHLRGMRGFRRASWVGVDIRGIDFTGAYLCRSFIHDQNYLEEFRRQSSLSNVVYWIWWATSDCGRSVLRWGAWTAMLILAYAWLYMHVDLDLGPHRTSLSHLYHSVVTMTTLGYGDIVPASTGAQWVAMLEVMTGYVMLGGLLSIFSNKMARRAD